MVCLGFEPGPLDCRHRRNHGAEIVTMPILIFMLRVDKKLLWLWLSWKSGRFRCLRFAVRIQSLAKPSKSDIYLFTVNWIEKTKIKKKNGPFFNKLPPNFRNENWSSRRQGDASDLGGRRPSPDQTGAGSKAGKQDPRDQISRMLGADATRT